MRVQDIDGLRDVQLREITGGAGKFSDEAHNCLLEHARKLRQLEDTILAFRGIAQKEYPGVEWEVSQLTIAPFLWVQMKCTVDSLPQRTEILLAVQRMHGWNPHPTVRLTAAIGLQVAVCGT